MRQNQDLLEELNNAVHEAGNSLEKPMITKYLKRYRKLLRQAEIECPPPGLVTS